MQERLESHLPNDFKLFCPLDVLLRPCGSYSASRPWERRFEGSSANYVYRAGFEWVVRASFPLLSRPFAVFYAFGLPLDGYFLAFFRLNPSLFGLQGGKRARRAT